MVVLQVGVGYVNMSNSNVFFTFNNKPIVCYILILISDRAPSLSLLAGPTLPSFASLL